MKQRVETAVLLTHDPPEVVGGWIGAVFVLDDDAPVGCDDLDEVVLELRMLAVAVVRIARDQPIRILGYRGRDRRDEMFGFGIVFVAPLTPGVIDDVLQQPAVAVAESDEASGRVGHAIDATLSVVGQLVAVAVAVLKTHERDTVGARPTRRRKEDLLAAFAIGHDVAI